MSRSGNKNVISKESTGRKIIEQSRIRLLCVALFFLLCFLSISYRMIEVAVVSNMKQSTIAVSDPENEASVQEIELEAMEPKLQRGDIVDRNGMLLATSLMTASVFVNPKEMKDHEEAASKLARTLDMDSKQLMTRIKSNKSFVWIKRNLTPKEQQAVNSLGIPGLYFLPEEKRVYPYGNITSHTLGYVGVDNKGLAGIEKQFDERLRDADVNSQPLALAVDVRLQAIMREEMRKAVSQFQAIGATGVIMDLRSGELLSMVSLPDFDPQKPASASDAAKFNRASLGSYEMGSTFKSFTMALGMEFGKSTMKSSYNTVDPFKVANFTINDDHPSKHWLTLPEVFAYSSNIGTARIALESGGKAQKRFLEKLGMMKPVEIELPERASPLYPSEWKEVSTVTISYGHGISVSPLHLVRGIGAMVNGGTMPRLTLLKDGNKGKDEGERVISEKTSENMRRLLRLVVNYGTGSKADVPGYRVGGKTGTAEKINSSGKYNEHAKMASFISVFPVDEPRYVVLVMVDEPKGDKSTYNFATGGWIAAPVAGKVIARMGPLLGIKPVENAPGDDAERFWVDNGKTKKQPTTQAAEKKFVHEASF